MKIVSVALVTDFNIMSRCDREKCPQFPIRVSPRMGPAHTVMERELLRIVETLKELRTIQPDQKLLIYTDHKNVTCKSFNTDTVLRWRLIIAEYGPDI